MVWRTVAGCTALEVPLDSRTAWWERRRSGEQRGWTRRMVTAAAVGPEERSGLGEKGTSRLGIGDWADGG
jgi:hypothetical protein